MSELVTNAVKYSRGDVTLRLVNERALVCEVIDSSGALPRLRSPNGAYQPQSHREKEDRETFRQRQLTGLGWNR